MTIDDLIVAHQAIIDAWYARWLEDVRARAEDLKRRRRANAEGTMT